MRHRVGRRTALTSTLAVLVLALTAGAGYADNLLANGGFEQNDGKGGAAGWALYPPMLESKGRGVSLVRPGYRSAQAVCVSEIETPGNMGMFGRPAAVTDLPGQEVLFTCYYKTQGDPGAHLSLVGYAEPFLQKEWRTPYLQSETQSLPATPNWSLVCWRFRFLPGVHEIVVFFRLSKEGRLYLDEAALRPYPTEVTCKVIQGGAVEALPKRRLVEVELRNHQPREQKLQVVALTLGENRPSVQAGMTNVRLAGDKAQTVRFNYDYDYRQSHLLRLTVQAADTPTIYDQQDLRVPGLVSAELTSPAFRNSLLESLPTPKLAVSGMLNVVPALRGQLKLSAELVGVAGGSFAAGAASPTPGAFRLELPTPTLLSGDHVVRVTAALPQGRQEIDLPLRRVSPGLPEVGYDEQRRLWVRGQRLFPLGLYGIEDPAGVQAAAASGFNFLVVSSSRASYDVRDAAVQAGIGVVVSAASPDASFWQHLQSKWGTSPACLGWLPYSRPDLRSYSPLQLEELYYLLTRLSPSQPVLEPLASPSLAQYYTRAADILLAWSLPVPHSPLRALGEMVEVLREAGGPLKPVWAIIQAQGGGAFQDEPLGPASTGRAPTPAEMEALAYLALIRGADGLVWYSYTPTQAEGGGPLPKVDPAMWTAMGALNLRLRWLSPILLDGHREAMAAVAGGAVEMARWHYQDADYVLAVNSTDRGLVTPLPLGRPEAAVSVLFEDRELKADRDGEVQESFPPFGVHVYMVGTAG